MQETKTTCDICRKLVDDVSVVEMRIDDKMHDVCEDCSGKLEKLLRGTGRPVMNKASILDSNYLGNKQPWNVPLVVPSPTILPMNPEYVPNNGTTIFLTTTGVSAGENDFGLNGIQVSGNIQAAGLPKTFNSNMTGQEQRTEMVNALFTATAPWK